MSLKDENHGAPWYEWPEGVRRHQYDTLQATYARLYDDVLFWRFVQFEFYKQWNALKAYVNNAGIEILGDLPIYVAHDSADVWAHPELFELDGDLAPVEVAGCPPDYFSETGQLWGNPVYNWDAHRADGYSWWLSRIAHAGQVYDRIRIDHFRGFESFWAIPAGDETAVNGCWKKGPGMDLFSRRKRTASCENHRRGLRAHYARGSHAFKRVRLSGHEGACFCLYAGNGQRLPSVSL